MPKYFAAVTLILFASACSKNESPPMAAADSSEALLEAYHLQSRQVQGRARYTLAAKTLLDDPTNLDEALGLRALKDIASISRELGNQGALFKVMTELLPQLEEGSKLWRMAYLVHARNALREGRIEEGGELFRAALREWENCHSPGVLNYYSSTLHELQMFERFAVDHYNWSLEFENAYEDSEFNLFRALYMQVTERRFGNAKIDVLGDIYPQLHVRDDKPEYQVIAKAICQIADGFHDEAIAALRALQANEPPPDELETYNEYRNIPLYVAAAVYRRDGLLDDATGDLDEFWDRNRDRPTYVMDAVLDIIGFTKSADQTFLGGDPFYVSKYLVDAGFTKDPTVREQVSDASIAHLLDLYQMGMLQHGDVPGCKKLCLEIVEEFFPETMGGANALCSLARIYTREEDLDAAEDAYLRVLAETRWRHWVRWSESELQNIWRIRRDPLTRIIDRVREMAGQSKSPGPQQAELEARLQKLYEEIAAEN